MRQDNERKNLSGATIGLVSLNEEGTIGRALQAIIAESEENDSEIIVVAGGTDRTVEIARNMLGGRARAKLIVDSEPRGKPAALNTIFSAASGAILILSDGDVEIQRGSIKKLLDAMSSSDVGASSGRVIGAPGRYNGVQKVSDLMTEMMHRSRLASSQSSGGINLASGYLYAIRKDLAKRVPENVNSDDGYLSLCVKSSGKKVAYVPGATVAINYPRTLDDFIKQKMRTRYGHLQLGRDFPSAPSRSAGTEINEYRLLWESARTRGYGLSTCALAVVLTGLVWTAAYIREYMPWLFRKKVWQPIRSTK